MGALAAAGHSTETMLEFFRKASPFRFSMVTVRKPGILDTAKVVANFREYFPDDSFEGLKVKLSPDGHRHHQCLASRSSNRAAHLRDPGFVFDAHGLHTHRDRRTVVCGRRCAQQFSDRETLPRPLRRGGGPLREPRSEPYGKATWAVCSRSPSGRFEVGMHFASKQKFHECDVMLTCPELNQYGIFDTKHHRAIFETGQRATLSCHRFDQAGPSPASRSSDVRRKLAGTPADDPRKCGGVTRDLPASRCTR